MWQKFLKFPKSVLIAVLGLLLAANFVIQNNKVEKQPVPLRQPPTKPYLSDVAGTGIIEGYGENINVAPYHAGKVIKVLVHQGQKVQAGTVLYELDSDELRALHEINQANVQSRLQYLAELKNSPRPEDIPPLQATVEQTKANYNDAREQLKRLEGLRDHRALSQDELTRKRFMVMGAKAQLDKSLADLAHMKAGAWKFDINKAQADYQVALATAKQSAIQLNQSVIRAPRSGEILQVNTRPGEYLSANPETAPVLLGNTKTMQIRIDIDEINASHIRPNMTAEAFLKGDPTKKFPLKFVRVEPYMVPKKNLNGSSTERVDVRVLQLVYSFEPPAFPVYVGQQVDVFLKK